LTGGRGSIFLYWERKEVSEKVLSKKAGKYARMILFPSKPNRLSLFFFSFSPTTDGEKNVHLALTEHVRTELGQRLLLLLSTTNAKELPTSYTMSNLYRAWKREERES
jgi:hypothetical protein